MTLRRLLVLPALILCGSAALGAGAGGRLEPDATWDSAYRVTAGYVLQYVAYGAQHSIAADSAGNIHLVWVDRGTTPYSIGYRMLRRADSTWLPETLLSVTTGSCGLPAIACDPDGNVHIAWDIVSDSTTLDGIWHRWYSVEAGAWQAETVVVRAPNPSVGFSHVSLACRPNGGNVHAVWERLDSTVLTVYHSEKAPGMNWAAPVRLGPGYSPCAAADGRGNVHVSYSSLGAAWLRQRIGGTWRNAEQVFDASVHQTSVATDTSGTSVHVAWHGDIETADEHVVLHRLRGPAGWSAPTVVSQFPDYDQESPVVTCTPDGRCDIVWLGNDPTSRNDRVYHAARFTTGVWSRPAPITPAGYTKRRACAVRSKDRIHATWYETSGGYDVWYCGGRDWQTDASVYTITSPGALTLPGAPLIPSLIVLNEGLGPLGGLTAFLFAESAGVVVYSESMAVGALTPGDTARLTFPEWAVGAGPSYVLTACISAAGDENPANDTLEQTLGVVTWRQGWTTAERAPGSIERGGWLELMAGSGRIYLTEGDELDFHYYEPLADSWVEMGHFPTGTEGKVPKKGSRGAADGERYIYATKGNNTCGFHRFDEATGTWEQLEDVPRGISNKRVKGGTDLQYVVINDTGYVYLLKGYRNEFYRYSTATGHWQNLPPAPLGNYPKWMEGSWLIHDGDELLYAHKAKRHELWVYDIGANAWRTRALKPMPYLNGRGKTKKSKDGAAPTWCRGSIFALKGGNTQEFWQYFPSRDSWVERETIPQVFAPDYSRKKVGYGGDLVYYGHGAFFATKGKKTRELWRYLLQSGGDDDIGRPAARAAAQGESRPAARPAIATVLRGVLNLTSDISSLTSDIVLVDVSGRRVLSLRPGPNDVSHIAAGVYFVREAAGSPLPPIRRLVVAR